MKMRIGALTVAILAATFSARAPGQAVNFTTVTQRAVAQDLDNSDSHFAQGFRPNSAIVNDGDDYGNGSASVDQNLVFDPALKMVAATATATASATGQLFGGEYTSSAQGTYTVMFTLTEKRDVIFTPADGSSGLTDSNSAQINPGTTLLPPGDYTLMGAVLAQADGLDGNTDMHAHSYNATLQFALPGDSNLDGKVNFSDLVTLARNYGVSSGATFGQGDFNGDGKVDFADLVILASNYGATDSGVTGAARVPEPASMALLFILAAGWFRRRV